jgi:hypothetical protein
VGLVPLVPEARPLQILERGGPLPRKTLSDDSYAIDLCDEAPAPVSASHAGCLRRPDRHGGGGVLSPLTTVQPCNRCLGEGVGVVLSLPERVH